SSAGRTAPRGAVVGGTSACAARGCVAALGCVGARRRAPPAVPRGVLRVARRAHARARAVARRRARPRWFRGGVLPAAHVAHPRAHAPAGRARDPRRARARGARGVRALPHALSRTGPRAGLRDRALRAAHGRGRGRVPLAARALRAARVPRVGGVAVGGTWAQLDPRAEQSARALGATPGRAFWHVTLPALAPAIASAASLVFLFCATSFGTVLVLGGMRYGTVETEIWVQTTQFLDLRAAAVLSVTQLVVVAGALWVAGRARARRERAVDLANESRAVRTLARAVAAPVAVTVLAHAALALPIVHLVVRSLRTPRGWGFDNYLALGTTGGANTLTVTVW